MVVDISKKFLIFEKNHHFSHFFGKNREKIKKNPDQAGKENVLSTGRDTGPVRNPLPDRTGPAGRRYRLQLCLVEKFFVI
jgi:hypothetical protein